MPLGLHARIDIRPERVLESRWIHDMANAFCRGKISAEAAFLTKQKTLLGSFPQEGLVGTFGS